MTLDLSAIDARAAAARTDVPQLADRVRELEAAVAELRAEVEAYRPIVDAAERWRSAGCTAAPVEHAAALIEAVDDLWRAEGVVA